VLCLYHIIIVFAMKYTLIAIVLLIILGGVIYYVAPLSQENKDVYSSDENTATSSEEAPFTSDEEIGVLQDQPSTEDASVSSSITRDQLAAHNSKDNCWVAYKGIVYDITKWLPRHPGSSAAIEPYFVVLQKSLLVHSLDNMAPSKRSALKARV